MPKLLLCSVMAGLVGCGISNAEIDDLDDESSGEAGAELEQGLQSGTPYYHWSNRNDQQSAPYEDCSPNLNQVFAFLQTHWGVSHLGCHGNRYVKGQNGAKVWSSHAWGAALDVSAGSWDVNFNQIAPFLIEHSEELGINALHDYRRVKHPDGTTRGRIWKPLIGWKPSNIGDSGTWIHIEVRPNAFADFRSVDERLVGSPVGADGCTDQRRADSAAFGCACVDGNPNGGWCPGTGCSAGQTAACAAYAAGCVDGQCRGIFAPGYACTKLEFKQCGDYLSGCTNHQCLGGAVGGDDGRSCSQESIYNCSRYGCGCKNDECSDGSCPLIP